MESAGVPAIVAGATEDKPAVAARVAYHGLGIDLHTANSTAQAVADATQTLLKDTETQDNVRRLTKVYARHAGRDRAADPAHGVATLPR